MNRTKPILLATAALLTCAVLGTAAAAVPGARTGNDLRGDLLGGSGQVLERLAQRLDLTPEQRDEIRAIVRGHVPALGAALRRVKAERLELFAEIHRHPPSEPAVRAAAADVGAAEADLAVLRAELVDEIYQTLTPEQQEKLKEIEADVLAAVESVAARIRAAVDAWLSR